MKLPDLGILIPPTLLSLIGLVITFSISPRDFISQLIFFALGMTFFLMITNVDHRMITATFAIAYIGGVVALVLTLIVGTVTRGSNRWLPIGSFQFQTSELMKPILILTMSQLSSILNLTNFSHFLSALVLLALPTLLVFIQPDLGSTIVLFLIGMVGILGLRPKKRFVIVFVALLLIVSPIAWNLLHDYQRTRVSTFLNPDSDPLGSSYNQIQATIAAGSGQIFGKGLGKGTQSHLQFLPEKHTDFFFASMAEELGFVGSATVILLICALCSRLLFFAGTTDKVQQQIIFLGIFTMFFFQSMTHIGINLGVLPVTGITLPFMSVGGSSTVVSWLSLGIAASAARDIKTDRAIFLR